MQTLTICCWSWWERKYTAYFRRVCPTKNLDPVSAACRPSKSLEWGRSRGTQLPVAYDVPDPAARVKVLGVFAWAGGPQLPSETWKAGPSSWAGARAGTHWASGAGRGRQTPWSPRIRPRGVVGQITDQIKSLRPTFDLSV